MHEETKICPFCGSNIPINVKKCKYCGEWLVIQEKDKPQKYYNFVGYMGILTDILAVLVFILYMPIFMPVALHLDIGIGRCIIGCIIGYIIIAICTYIYFLPTLIADYKRTQHTLKIFLINLLLGATGVVWLACLIGALYLPDLSKNEENTEDNIENTEPSIQNEKNCEDFSSKVQIINTNDMLNKTKQCPYCAELIPINSTFCNICETSLTQNFSDKVPQIEYTSFTKQIENKEIPNDIKHWNWGAFWLSWIWGIGNKSYLALLSLIPYFGFIWIFICGAKGNEWAWKNKQWDSIEDFNNVQKKWTIIGNIFVGGIILLVVVSLILFKILDNNNTSSDPINYKQTTVQEEINSTIEEQDDFVDMSEEDYNSFVKENQQQEDSSEAIQQTTQEQKEIVQPQVQTQQNVDVPSQQNYQPVQKQVQPVQQSSPPVTQTQKQIQQIPIQENTTTPQINSTQHQKQNNDIDNFMN